MALRPDMELAEYLAILRRRKWLIIYAVMIVVSAGIVYCVLAEELYKSNTTILVVPQRVPESYVRSTVNIKIEDRLETIRQQIMSRTVLASVIEELGLFRQERKTMPVEQFVDLMRNRIDVQIVRGKEAFSLSFLHEDPRMAMLTTARLASYFVDENLKAREQQAVGTSDFLESQLVETKKRLEEQEERVKAYKMQYMGELPEEVASNLSTLTRLQDRLRTISDSLRSNEDRKVFLEAQIGSIDRMARMASNGTDNKVVMTNPFDPAKGLKVELAEKEARLEDLASRYTPLHPDVVRIRREIESLKNKIAGVQSEAASSQGQKDAQESGRETASRNYSSPEREEIHRLKNQVAAIDLDIVSLKRERQSIERSIAEYQVRVSRSPRREQEIIALTRDYNNLRTSYDDLLKKKLDAQLSQNLEKRQKGEQFIVLDPANLPGFPFKPERKKVMGIAVLASFILGILASFTLEYLDRTVHGRKDYRHHFNLPLLACVPVIQDEKYQRVLWRKRIAAYGGCISIVMAIAVFSLIYNEKILRILSSH